MTESIRAPATIAARLDRLPPTRYLRRLVMRIALGGFFEFYDLFMTGYIGIGLIDAKIFRATTDHFFDINGFASFVGIGFAGMYVGTLAFSWASDRYGRRAVFTSSLFGYSLTTFCMAFATTPLGIDIWRFLTGIGVGVQVITMSTYIAEISPNQSRGRFIQMAKTIAFCGVPVVAGVSRLAIPHTILGLDGWRYVAMAGGLGIVAVWFMRAGLPESARWLDTHGRHEDAQRIMEQMESAVERELGHALPPAQTFYGDEGIGTRGAWSEIWSRAYIGRTLVLSTFNFFQSIGFYGFAAWVPILLLSEGISVPKSLTYGVVIALLNPLGPLLAMYYADRIERKWQIVGLALSIAVVGLLWAQQRSPGAIIVLGAAITLANNAFAGALHTYQAELYPTRIRAEAVGFVYSWSRLSSIFIGFVIAAILKVWGVSGVFGLIACAMVISAFLIGVFGPKTNRLRLEAISH